MFTLGVLKIFFSFELSKFMMLMCRIVADGGTEDFLRCIQVKAFVVTTVLWFK